MVRNGTHNFRRSDIFSETLQPKGLAVPFQVTKKE